MNCRDCGEWVGPTDIVVCGDCVREVFSAAQDATKQDAFNDVVVMLTDLSAALDEVLETHANEWRSNEERATDTRARESLSRARRWLSIPR